jgi:hypothetical protein
MGGLQQQGQSWLDQFGAMGGAAGNLAGNLANFNSQNPFQMQQNYALNQMAGGGFNPQMLQQFQNQFNPNTGTGMGGGMPQPTGGGWPMLPTQPPPQPSPQTGITGYEGLQKGFGGGMQGGGMPFAPGVQPQAGGGGQPQPQMGGGAPGGMVGGQPQPTNPFGVGLNQAAGPGTTTGFTGTPTNAPTPQAPTQGAGGQFLGNMFTGGFGADVGQARQAQLSGLLGQTQAPGMTQAQQDQMFAAQYDPAKQAINEAQNNALAQLSARGMGRSSAGVGNVETGRMRALGSAAQQAGANVTGQNLNLTQRQSEFGLGGLGQFAGQGIQGALGVGGLGLGSEQLGTGNQLAMNQQNMAAQNQQFAQDNARAGLDLARYQTEQGFNMQQYRTDLQAAVQKGQLDEATAGRMAQNALQTTQQGLQAQGMQNQNNQALMNATLGAGGQNLQAMLGAGGLYGNIMGQLGGAGMGTQQLYQGGLENAAGRLQQQELLRMQMQAQDRAGGGLGGFLGGLAGTAAGSFLGPVGAAAGGALGSNLFGGGNPSTTGGGANPYWNPFGMGGG